MDEVWNNVKSKRRFCCIDFSGWGWLAARYPHAINSDPFPSSVWQNSMNLPPDKARLLRQYDNEKKWELICDQVIIAFLLPASSARSGTAVRARCPASCSWNAAPFPSSEEEMETDRHHHPLKQHLWSLTLRKWCQTYSQRSSFTLRCSSVTTDAFLFIVGGSVPKTQPPETESEREC